MSPRPWARSLPQADPPMPNASHQVRIVVRDKDTALRVVTENRDHLSPEMVAILTQSIVLLAPLQPDQGIMIESIQHNNTMLEKISVLRINLGNCQWP